MADRTGPDGSPATSPDATTPLPDALDGLIAGRFRVGSLLGTGGSASVFRAVDTSSGETVAVKILHPELSRRPALRRAFVAEADRVRGLRHPHLAAVVDAGIAHGPGGPIAWIAQELAPGSTLAETVELVGPLTVAQATTVAIDLLDALEAVHAAGLVHRDVSPSNVMVALAGDAVAAVTLLDFGLADAAGRTAHGSDLLRSSATTEAATVIGNVRYASPEQLRGAPVGPRGDLYQAGATLFFALTGSEPFPRADVREAIRAQLAAPPPVASAHVRGIPPSLDRAIVRAMLKQAGDRHPDARAFAAELRDIRAVKDRARSAPHVRGPDVLTRVLPHPEAGRQLPVAGIAAGAVDDTTAGEGDAAVARERRFPWLVVGLVLTVAAALIGPAVLATSSGAPPAARPGATGPTPATSPSAPRSPSVVAAPALAGVPSLDSLAGAPAALAAVGLRLGTVVEEDSPREKGAVLASDPAIGARVAPGTTVSLTVASGRNAVPAVAGMSREAAFEAIRSAGFVPWELAVAVPGVVAGTAVTTRPDRAVSEWLGNVITVLVASDAGPTPDPTPDESPAASPTPAPVP
ncbi:MAG: protein kinase [Microbacterium sp.]|uniref:serine/threonine-protein kinase n=1 Tax=Microbacterium sp. TaxID=51671 RepID=UPI001AC8D7D3|nr:serine/threonine-protein kinase [Microbacterium sp.]MBN9153307.1 protein kinase [Microbacterium sp.]